jgi:hypothetical protein
MLIATAPASRFRDHKPLADVREVVQQLAGVGIVDHGSDGHRQVNRFTFPSAALAAFAMPATLRGVFGIKTEMQESVVVCAGDHEDVAAAAAIAATGSTARNKFLAPEGKAAVAAIPGFHADSDFINKHVGD